jgi:long-subunit acyl-CoA synthetase (AMP-forming)
MSNEQSVAQLSEVYGRQDPEIHHSLWYTFAKQAESSPDAVAVLSLWQEGSDSTLYDGGRVTFSGLKRGAELIARSIHRHCSNGAILAILGNSMEWAFMLWTAARLHVPFAGVDPRSRHQDLRHYIEAMQPTVVVVQHAEAANSLNALLDEFPCIICRVTCTRNCPGNWKSLHSFLTPG